MHRAHARMTHCGQAYVLVCRCPTPTHQRPQAHAVHNVTTSPHPGAGGVRQSMESQSNCATPMALRRNRTTQTQHGIAYGFYSMTTAQIFNCIESIPKCVARSNNKLKDRHLNCATLQICLRLLNILTFVEKRARSRRGFSLSAYRRCRSGLSARARCRDILNRNADNPKPSAHDLR